MKQYKQINDPGHGWLSVSLKELVGYNLKEISPYSYMSMSRAYLEEDVDAGLFLKKLKEQKIDFKVVNSHVEKTNIRNMDSFSFDVAEKIVNMKEGDKVRLYSTFLQLWSIEANIEKIDKKEIVIKSGEQLYTVKKSNALKYFKFEDDELRKIKHVTNQNGVVFVCQIDGDSIKIYDSRYKMTKLGQFVSSYYIKTLLETSDDGLILDTGSKDWVLSKNNIKAIKEWLSDNPVVKIKKSLTF